MFAAADHAKNHLLELKDNLKGSLKILTTPELATNYVVIPALSDWMAAHQKLDIIIETQSNLNDLPNNHDIDLVIKLDNYNIKNTIETVYLALLHQVVVASPIYLNKKIKVQQPYDLLEYKLINMKSIPQCEYINMKKNNEDITIHMPVRLSSHDVSVVKTLCKNSFGVARILSINVQEELLKGELV
ncbi:LysR substrate-binding domain-containing protein [Acinetobacter nectaris]|uniref:LysR substrate-binding domain-containing protein n=1 Tax=Acinetobacter nectaris TaxID=1219382 RepID=UPI0023515B3E|nr:LysR substrate-binding domain-containing protein [Acinetobacter nectaris]